MGEESLVRGERVSWFSHWNEGAHFGCHGGAN